MNNKKQRNRLFTMLMLVMAILMPYGGHGHRRFVNRQWVTVVQAILTKYQRLRNWHGFALM